MGIKQSAKKNYFTVLAIDRDCVYAVWYKIVVPQTMIGQTTSYVEFLMIRGAVYPMVIWGQH